MHLVLLVRVLQLVLAAGQQRARKEEVEGDEAGEEESVVADEEVEAAWLVIGLRWWTQLWSV